MPKSIFDVLNEYYYNSGSRQQSDKVRSVPKLFIKSKIKSDLAIHQRMSVFSFMMALENATDISFVEQTIF
jgi:hypothetical protein